ncbi:helix-turn-helix domain-containing protein [Microbispora sp. NBC_01189]|uniref:helix-turn-helix domain-containing protein n=1 Tax=Microbispora sp. NBC_01189 TaxID=2903583 RepID=UPI002E0D9709|nr:helix-turn-helix domain-containing protein [Microbispora sp. NBC_01189]
MQDASTDPRRIGDNVRRARRYRGKSISELAGLIGRSKGWLSKIENGLLPLDKRGDIAAIADALEVSAVDLIGESASAIPRVRRYGDIMRLREVLLDSTLTSPPDVAARSLADIAAGFDREILAARQASDHATLCRLLPDVVAELHVHAVAEDERDRTTALRLLVDACAATTFLLRHNGQIDLAWIAADRAAQAAALLDDPITTGAAIFAQAHARPSAARVRALRTAGTAADAIEPYLGDDRRAHEVYGMLRLSAALAHAIEGNHDAARDQADEASAVADRVGDHPDAWQWFGPSNVGTWRCLLAVEAGEPREALRYGSAVDRSALASRGRESSLHVEMARAHAMLGDTAASVAALRTAERLAAPRVHHNPLVRELVTSQLERARREAGGRELRGLAYRMGVM